MYGALEGLSKPQMALELGVDFVQSWRSGLLARPPPMSPEHPHWHAFERKYADLTPEEIPITESLQDTMNRTLPLWESRILPALQAGRNVMIVAHGNSLRGIVKHIDSLSQDEIQNVGIPNGIPLVYKFNKKMEPVPQPMAVSPLSGEFLEKKGLLRAALEREAELAKNVPGYEIPPKDALFVQQPPTNSDPYIRGLSRLSQERLLLEMVENTGQTPPTVAEVSRLNSEERGEGREERKKTLSEEFSLNVGPLKTDFIAPTGPSSSPVPMVPSTERKPVKSSLVGGDYLVIIRHGKTEHNKLGLFTGWEVG
jgi:2,3-bisphosphoglycerate-dependent phosphoglycerate mutase